MESPQRHPAPTTLSAEGQERLRRDLLQAGLSGAALPPAVDREIQMAIQGAIQGTIQGAIRGATRSSLHAPGGVASPAHAIAARGRRHLRWGGAFRAAAVAAMVTLVAWLSTSVPHVERWVDSRLVAAARIVAKAEDRQAVLADPRLRALLTAMVAMPKSSRPPILSGGEFVQFDLMLDSPTSMPLSWLVEVELPGRLVGIEGGDAPFVEPATYDPDALSSGWVRLANVATDVPVGNGPIRIATLMVQRGDPDAPRVLGHVGVGAAGESLALAVHCVERVKGGTER